MPKNKQKAAASAASQLKSTPTLPIEVYSHRLWTVTQAGMVMMPVSTPPDAQDECFGSYWDVKPCGDRGGPPANQVRKYET